MVVTPFLAGAPWYRFMLSHRTTSSLPNNRTTRLVTVLTTKKYHILEPLWIHWSSIITHLWYLVVLDTVQTPHSRPKSCYSTFLEHDRQVQGSPIPSPSQAADRTPYRRLCTQLYPPVASLEWRRAIHRIFGWVFLWEMRIYEFGDQGEKMWQRNLSPGIKWYK